MSTRPRDDLIARAFAEERIGTARLVLRYRALAVFVWFLATLGFGLGGVPDSRAQTPWMGAYAALSLVVLVACASRPALSWWMILVLDLPMITAVTWVGTDVARVPILDVTIMMGPFVLLIFLAELSMRAFNVGVGTAATCAGLLAVLAHVHQVAMAPFYLIVLVLAGVLASFRLGRARALLERIAREQRVRERLGRYFSPEVAQTIIAAGDAARVARRCEVTVLFLDLRDFTALSEAMGDRILEVLDELFGAMVTVLFRRDGTLDKFTGDGLMAYFGAPIARPDHAAAAVACAGEMLEALAAVNRDREARGEPVLRVGIGLHSGPVVVGDLGPEARREFTAVGDTVNVASRVESLTKQHGVPVLATAETRRLAGDDFGWVAAPVVPIKGKSEPIATFVPGFAAAPAARPR